MPQPNFERNTKIIIWIVVIAVISITLGIVLPSKIHPQKNLTIVAFGDGLVQGVGATPGHDFVTLLSQRVRRPITNRGINADTTTTALNRLSSDVLNLRPNIVIILLGSNDTLHQTPPVETFANLGMMIDRLQQSGAKVLLLGVRSGTQQDEYKYSFAQLAASKHVPFVPNVLDGIYGNSQMLSDGQNPNDAGYRQIADKVEPALKQTITEAEK